MGRALVMIAVAALLGGCGNTSLLTASTPPASPHSKQRPAAPRVSTADYLAQLGSEQQQLAAAERALPRHARTASALSRATTLLAGAIHRLAAGLAAIHPPAGVSSLHARLVSIVGAYAARLERAARLARQRGRALKAGNELIAATTVASTEFSTTIARIERALGG